MIAALEAHPAKFSTAITNRIDEIVAGEALRLDRPLRILDPFAGVGRVHLLAEAPHSFGRHETVGVELEPEWAANDPRTIVGDATALPFAADSFDVLVTSPCYGNRMKDSHNARERCRPCAGTGYTAGTVPGVAREPCLVCGGAGRRAYKRNTYTHTLGRKPSAGSAAVMAWGRPYRRLHEQAWAEAERVLRSGSLVVVNVKNHVETIDGALVEHPVTEWHLNAWLALGAKLLRVVEIETPGQRHGANRDARADCERLLVLRSRGVAWVR